MWNYPILITLLVSIGGILSQSTESSDLVTDCICVPYYLCDIAPDKRTIITDGRGIIDERANFPKCDKLEEICCSLENKATTPKPPGPTSVPLASACGIRNPDGIGHKIVNDENVFNLANFGEFPWMVGILKSNGAYRCGGSLIHPSVVLTAAHCVKEKDTYTARAGEWDSSLTAELIKHQNVKVASIKLHENYIPGIYHNDIALLFLEKLFTPESHISTICLPQANITVGGRCYTHGWGRDRFANGSFPNILKKIELPMVEKSKCQQQMQKTRLGAFFKLHDSFVCAGGEEGKDSCVGDGGGPLVCRISEDDEKYQQIGIVSWGIGCGDKDVPGIYANVPFLREWIDKQLADKNLKIIGN